MDLHSIVVGLEGGPNAAIVAGLDPPDDAAVILPPPDAAGLALVQTLDFITPVCDDPFHFGQVAAANSVSDVYAMGGRVYTALNICCFPGKGVPLDALRAILEGGADKVREAGGTVLGGHTVRDDELKYGLSVTGFVHPDRVWRKRGALPGDLLLLTKPLGTGLMISGRKRKVLDEAAIEPVIRNMSRLNRYAAETAARFRVHAATDITGFGLAGHASEMVSGGGVEFRVVLDRLPVYPEVPHLLAKGVGTGVTEANRAYTADHLRVEPAAVERSGILFDPQTSGGLLLAVHPGDGEAMRAALREGGDAETEVIGEVVEGTGGVVVC